MKVVDLIIMENQTSTAKDCKAIKNNKNNKIIDNP